MKVLMLSWEYPPHVNGGMGAHVRELVPALLANDPDLILHLITPSFNGDAADELLDRLVIHRVKVDEPADQRFYDDVVAANVALAQVAADVLQAEQGFDLMHVHDWLVGFAALEVASAYQVPILATIHATERGRHRGGLYNDLSRAIDGAEGRLVQGAQGIITCSRAMKQEVQEYFGAAPERVVTIPNGIDPARFRALRRKNLKAFRARYAQPHEKIVLHVGRLVYEKGADLLVEAAPRVLQQVPEAKFIIGGRGPMEQGLEQRIQEMHLDERVTRVGFLSDEDRDKLYVVADVCVFPSRYEPFGIVALESMAAGTPVVVSDIGGLATVVVHDVTGLTAYNENVDSFAWAILKTLQESKLSAQRAKRALARIDQCLTWDHIAVMTLGAYRRVAESGTLNVER